MDLTQVVSMIQCKKATYLGEAGRASIKERELSIMAASTFIATIRTYKPYYNCVNNVVVIPLKRGHYKY